MKIKHIETGIEQLIGYPAWYKDFIKTGLYNKYEILYSDDVVELHRIKDDGSVGITVLDNGTAKGFTNKLPNKFKIEKNSFKHCDKHLRNKSIIKNQSFTFRFKNIWYSIPRLKTIYEYITNSAISKLTSKIITGVLIILVASIIWAIFKNDLINTTKLIFNLK